MSIYKKVTIRFILYITVPTLVFVLGIILGSATTTEKFEKEVKQYNVIDRFVVNYMDSCEVCEPNYFNYYLRDSAFSIDYPFVITLPGKKFKNDTFLLIIK